MVLFLVLVLDITIFKILTIKPNLYSAFLVQHLLKWMV
ncbi:hypothetical protein vBEcoMphAPEC6_gp322c [Escherichia phage vB_EcoM_phAPEC6]|nr:hypothetical protein vBEcoMphAPEC6_gp322c [Escherichia phage vB_EcoM_phAPEC6]